MLLGAVVCKRAEHAARLLEFRTRTGIVAAPDAAWLLLRGLNARGPGRARERAASRARRAPGGASGGRDRPLSRASAALLSFDVADGEAARRVETSTRLIINATSLGGVNSTMESRHRWEGDRVPRGLLRLSVGLEPVEVLWRDLDQALEHA